MRSLSSREILKILKRDGWLPVRINGSHHQLKHSVKPGVVTVPHPKKDLSQDTVRSIFKQAGLELE